MSFAGTDKESSSRYWAQKIINGGIAGIVGVTFVFPLDLSKTRLQNQQPGPDGKLPYKGLRDCLLTTVKKEGPRAAYRGLSVNLLFITPEKAIKLVGNDGFRRLFSNSRGEVSLSRGILAGGCAGLCQIIVTTPMELLKIQLQDAGRSAMLGAKSGETKLTATKVALNLFKEKGIRGVYKGFYSTMLRDVTFSAIYFPFFAALNSVGKRKKDRDEAVFYHSFCSGVVAGTVASLAVTPFDVVKTRLQTITKGSTDKTYSGIMDCFRKTLAHEGIKAFFKGGYTRAMVIAPLFGIAQTVYYFGIAEGIFSFYDNSMGYM